MLASDDLPRQEQSAFHATHGETLRLALELPEDQRADWLASGRVLSARAAAEEK